MTSNIVVFDTSVYVDQLRTGCHQTKLDSFVGLIRNSAVVLSDLWRGATKKAEREFVRDSEQNHLVLVPTGQHWVESGQILNRVYQDHGFTAQKLRDLHFDVLIALTARSCGGKVVTSNKVDFELILRYQKFNLEIWNR